jgi:hypothetical protein
LPVGVGRSIGSYVEYSQRGVGEGVVGGGGGGGVGVEEDPMRRCLEMVICNDEAVIVRELGVKLEFVEGIFGGLEFEVPLDLKNTDLMCGRMVLDEGMEVKKN